MSALKLSCYHLIILLLIWPVTRLAIQLQFYLGTWFCFLWSLTTGIQTSSMISSTNWRRAPSGLTSHGSFPSPTPSTCSRASISIALETSSFGSRPISDSFRSDAFRPRQFTRGLPSLKNGFLLDTVDSWRFQFGCCQSPGRMISIQMLSTQDDFLMDAADLGRLLFECSPRGVVSAGTARLSMASARLLLRFLHGRYVFKIFQKLFKKIVWTLELRYIPMRTVSINNDDLLRFSFPLC